MKNLILVFVCLMLFIPCQAAENQSEQERQNQQQLEPQKKEFAEIERYISRLHREIENDFEVRRIELNQRAQSEIELLGVADKAVYASLAAQTEVAKTVLNIDNYGYQSPWDYTAETDIMPELKDEFIHKPYVDFEYSIKNTVGAFEYRINKSNEWYQKLIAERRSEILAGRRFAEVQSQVAERKSRILAQLEWETLNLERQKQYALTVRLPQLEKQLKENLLKPEPEATHGAVTGILYSADKSSAIVDRDIVHNGDSIYGAKVIKIYKDKVEFEKNGKKWEQKVQQKPEAYWK